MSSDAPNGDANQRGRRSSITQAALSNLFQRGSSAGAQQNQGPNMNDPQRRRLSVTTLGLSGAPGANPNSASAGLGIRRSSMSTNSNNSDAIDESAIEDDDIATNARTAPTTPFTRHMSFGTSAMRNYRPSGSGSPGNDQQGFNWSEQLRTRAESSFSQSATRPSFSFSAGSPPRNGSAQHDRAKSVSDMPQPPAQTPTVAQPKQNRQKPDAFQERILKGDFYMD